MGQDFLDIQYTYCTMYSESQPLSLHTFPKYFQVQFSVILAPNLSLENIAIIADILHRKLGEMCTHVRSKCWREWGFARVQTSVFSLGGL